MKRYIIGLTLASALTMGLTSCLTSLRSLSAVSRIWRTTSPPRKNVKSRLPVATTSSHVMTGGRFTNSTTSATLPPMIAGWVTPHKTLVNIEQQPCLPATPSTWVMPYRTSGSIATRVSPSATSPSKNCTTEIQRREVSEATDCRG